jgi:hypothetical protein
VSRSPLRATLERRLLDAWRRGENPRLSHLLAVLPSHPPEGPEGGPDGGPDGEQTPHPAARHHLPAFSRSGWVSEEARSVWEPRLRRARIARARLECLSVSRGMRRCALLPTAAEPEVRAVASGHGLELAALAGPGADRGDDGPWTALTNHSTAEAIAVGSAAALEALRAALADHDLARVAGLVGVPACCAEAARQRLAKGLIDHTWSAASGAPWDAPPDARHPEARGVVTVRERTETNILWRALDIALIPHLPCGPGCRESVGVGLDLSGLARDSGLLPELTWIEDILSWPVAWSTLHGIAELKTPILRLVTRSDVTHVKRTLHRTGEGCPVEGAAGTTFPYRRTARVLVGTPAFRRGLANNTPDTP